MQKLAPFLLVPFFATIGAANNQREWLGCIAGGLIGLFFALLLSDLLPTKIMNAIYPGKEVSE